MTFATIFAPIGPGRRMVDDFRVAAEAARRLGAEVTGVDVLRRGARLLVVGVRSDEEFDALSARLRQALPDEFWVREANSPTGAPHELVIHAELSGKFDSVNVNLLHARGWSVTHHYVLYTKGTGGKSSAAPMTIARFQLAPPAAGREHDTGTRVVEELRRITDLVKVLDYLVTYSEAPSSARQLFTLELGE